MIAQAILGLMATEPGIHICICISAVIIMLSVHKYNDESDQEKGIYCRYMEQTHIAPLRIDAVKLLWILEGSMMFDSIYNIHDAS